jgi:diguanylate cyclase (GGDEF)-like protein/PAS domain S-box-containing protein/putative nucleotidyltransferase with HDIG domain
MTKEQSKEVYKPEILNVEDTIIDSTENKNIEEQLEQNYKDLLESQKIAHVGTWRLNLVTNQVVWSEELYRMYGFDSTLPPPPYTEHMKLFTPKSWKELSEALNLTSTIGIPYELELETVTADGSNGWMWVRGEAEKDSKGNIISLWGAAQDISKQKKTENEIRQSEEKFQLLFNQAPLGYLSLDVEGRVIEVNQKWLDTLGYSKEEVIGKWFGDFLCPEYVDGFRQRFQIFKSQGFIHIEFEMQSKDKQRLHISFEGKIVYGADGAYKQTHCILQDITRQRKAETALIESEERYKCLFEYSGLGIGYYTTNGIIISYNKQALENMGGNPEDFAGKSIRDIFPIEEAEKYFARIEKAIVSDQPQDYEDYLILDSGPRWYSSTFTKVKNVIGEVIGVQIASLDITERKLAEEALQESQAILKAAFENSQAGIAIADAPDGKLRYVNKAGLLIRERSEDVLVKNIDIHSYVDSWKIFHSNGTPYKENEVPLARAVLYGETCSEEFVIRRDNFEDRHVLANAAPIKDSSNKIIAGIVVFLDITEKRQAEEETRKQNELFSSLLKLLPVGVFMVDAADGKPLISNEMATALTGRGILPDANELNLSEVYKAYKNDTRKQYPTAEMPIVLGMKGISAHIEDMVVERPDGTRIQLEVFGSPVNDTQGKPWASLVTFMDITSRKKAEMDLKESEKLFRTSFESATIGGAMVAKDGTFIEVNDKACEIWGYAREELLQQKFTDITYKEDVTASIDLVTKLKIGQADNSIMEKRYLRKDGKVIWGLVSVSAIRNEKNEFVYFLAYIQDITEMKETANNLIYLSYHDYLTDFYNRRFFEEELEKLDSAKYLPLSIIICDINGLKLINDSFGHVYGDQLLIKAAETIREACRADDIISRIGGDEFAILLPNTDAEETMQIANKIKLLASKVEVSNIELSISYGYDTKTSDKQKIIELLANAENYMYRHKLYERSSMRSKTIDIIMNTLFEKSNRESMHSNRVSSICTAIASEMNFDKDDVNKIRIAGLVHDIGKIGIDEKILNKPGKLSDDERDQINKHPEVGWRILSSANEFSELANFILNHHERWDGRGYPNGLSGEDIPLEARIIAVADSYDAMTSERGYRTSLSQDEAIKEMQRCSGTQFDPDIVEVFVEKVLHNNLIS